MPAQDNRHAQRARRRAVFTGRRVLWLAFAWLAVWMNMAFAQNRETDPASLRPPRPAAAAAVPQQVKIAVIYPELGEPFRSFFAKIIDGIRDEAKASVSSFAIAAGGNSPDLGSELRRQDARVLIALGRQGLKTARTLGLELPIVAGGVLSIPDSEAQGSEVYTLAPDPNLLFDHLLRLVPRAKRIFVVFDARQNAWLIRLAQEAAKARGLELVAHDVQDLKTAIREYQEILAAADPKSDAIWLPQDSTAADEATILPLVLQEAWSRKLVVFSSNDAHVERGALFSLVPDGTELGRSLARAALASRPGAPAKTARRAPLRESRIALNPNTAGHLGLRLDSREALSVEEAYVAKVRAYVQSRKRYPTGREASLQRPTGTVRAWVALDRSGALQDAGIERSANSMLLDNEALKLLRLGAYPPFPADAFPGKTSQRFLFDLEYSAHGAN